MRVEVEWDAKPMVKPYSFTHPLSTSWNRQSNSGEGRSTPLRGNGMRTIGAMIHVHTHPLAKILDPPLVIQGLGHESIILTRPQKLFYLLLRSSRGAEYCDQLFCLSVCLSVRLRAYLWNRWTDFHEIGCADPLRPWLGLPLTELRYVMYFRFMDDVTFGRNGPYGDAWLAGLRYRAESDVCGCLVYYSHKCSTIKQTIINENEKY